MIAPRLWQVSILTTTEGEEAVCGLLEGIFSLSPSVYWSEKTGAVVVSVYTEKLPGPQRALRSVLEDALKGLRNSGVNLGKTKFTIKPLPRGNWAESWKRHFKPIEIGKQLLIKPSWSRRQARPDQHSIILDPELSFGTGHHPTTLFCLQQLARFRRREAAQSFLDIGCGSGILAIAAAKLGYSPVVAFDNDPAAIRTCRRNTKSNKVCVTARLTDLTQMPQFSRRRYDLICANLICDLFMKEAEKIRHLLKPGGHLVIAGILCRQFPEIEKRLHKFNLTCVQSSANKEWKSGRFALVEVHAARTL